MSDGKWEFSRGSPDCPGEIKIDTEEPAISATVLESAAKGGTLSQCTGAGKIDLVKAANDGNAFQKAIVNNKDSNPVYGGAQKGALKCSALDIPANTFWLFFSPEDEFKVNPSKTLPKGINEFLAANSANDVEFEEDKEYLVLGNLCVYKQESRGNFWRCGRAILSCLSFGGARSDFNAFSPLVTAMIFFVPDASGGPRRVCRRQSRQHQGFCLLPRARDS